MNSPSHRMYLRFIAITQLTILIFSGATLGQENRLRMEPPNWWVDMSLSHVQVMFHGEELKEFDVVSKSPGASINAVHTADSPNYLFIDLDLSELRKPNAIALLFEKGDTSFMVDYPILQRMESGWKPTGFDGSDVIYLITPDRFANGDPSNDEHPEMMEKLDRSDLYGRHGGDIEGILMHVNYLDSMGFTAVWSSPLMENNQPEASYHGYAVTDLYRIDPRMGDLEDYQHLADQLHERGMKLIMDYIPNHIGDHHWWMSDLPFTDWINYEGNFHPTHHNRNTIHDPYATDADRKGFTDGWFVKSMPDLNQRNPFLATYLLQNSIWWIETAKLDGLRVDTYPYSDRVFLNTWSCALRQAYPTLGMVGEEWTDQQSYIAYWQAGNDRNPETCLPALFDFPLQTALASALTQDEGWNSGWVKLHEALARDHHYPDPNQLVIFLDNHDMDRFYRQIGEDTALYEMGLSILLTMRGIPQVYYGTELLARNEKGGHHGDIRSHFPGTWPKDTSDARRRASLTRHQQYAQDVMHRLLEFRGSSNAIRQGTFKHFLPKDDVYCFVRQAGDEVVLVLSNKATDERTFSLADHLSEVKLTAQWKNVMSGKAFAATDDIQVPAKTTLILNGQLKDEE